jgi:organic radical activating enzyme
MADNDLPLGTLREKSLKEIWNSERFRQIRKNMLNERPSKECRRCYEQERVGRKSMRQSSNEVWDHWYDDVISLTEQDGGLKDMKLGYLDIRFSNICNYRCRTCGPDFSSSWHEDRMAVQPNWEQPKLIHPTQDPEELWKQVREQLPYVEKIYFAGGEPILMKEHYEILRGLQRAGRVDVELIYNTNLSTLSYGKEDILHIWKDFKKVTVGGSVDAPGTRGEYIRKGQEYNRVKENRARMRELCPHVSFFLSPTLSVMNAFAILDLHREWVREGLVAVDDFSVTLVQEPQFYRVDILPETLKLQLSEMYLSYISEIEKASEKSSSLAVGTLRAAHKFMMLEDRHKHWPEFVENTSSLDQIRGERFLDIFPEFGECYP